MPLQKREFQPLPARQPFQRGDARLAFLDCRGRGGISVERAGFISVYPDTDQVARDFVPLRQAVQGFAAQEFLGHLTVQLNVGGSVLRQGLSSFESPVPRSIRVRQSVRPQGRAPG